ncbi:MAG TPA: hypothetical protein PKA05_23910, partial [Roseiflexaceae bacterium]|nr:hypothetical protein [Roseiflexaceae bacterium]
MITTAEILSRRQRGVRLAFALACLPLLLLLLWLGYAFGVRMLQLLGYPYPLDYGEGPLLAQVAALAGGTPLPALYGDPDQPPFLVVNYPPLFHLLTLLLAWPAGSLLTAGRIVSLLAAPAALAALAGLIRPTLPGRLRSMARLPA